RRGGTGADVCAPIVCGDGIVDAGEECDDGNTASGDGCDATCHAEPGFLCHDVEVAPTGDVTSIVTRNVCDPLVCGDGVIVNNAPASPLLGEQCDDGNDTSGDGCS